MSTLPETNVDALKRVCPPLYTRGADEYTFWLDLADGQLATSAQGWGNFRTLAAALLAAHLWTRLTGGGTPAGLPATSAQVAGAVTGESYTDRSRSYGSLPANTLERAELATTVYGAQFLRLRESRPGFGARVVLVPIS